MKTAIEAILYQILKDNMASWNAVPNSIRLIGISLFPFIFYYLGFWTFWKKVLGKKINQEFQEFALGKKIYFSNSGMPTNELAYKGQWRKIFDKW